MFSDSKHIIPNSKYNCQLYLVSPCDFHNYYDTHVCEAQFIIRNNTAINIYEYMKTGMFYPQILLLNEACQVIFYPDIVIQYAEFKDDVLTLNTTTKVKSLKFIEKNNNLLSVHVHNVNGYYEFAFSI